MVINSYYVFEDFTKSSGPSSSHGGWSKGGEFLWKELREESVCSPCCPDRHVANPVILFFHFNSIQCFEQPRCPWSLPGYTQKSWYRVMSRSVSPRGWDLVFIASLTWEVPAAISYGDMGPAPESVMPQAGLTMPWQVAASCVEAEISNGTLENCKKSRLTLISNQEYNLRQVMRVVRHSFISEVLCNLRFHKRWSFPLQLWRQNRILYFLGGKLNNNNKRKTSQMPQNKKVT